MLSEILDRIAREYPAATTAPFKDHALAHYIRQTVPQLLKTGFAKFAQVEWKASPGNGQWAEAPWIAALDLLVTETPQNGYFPVYLFTKSLDAVYLSLNQGMTSLRDEFGADEARHILATRALILRARLHNDYPSHFTTEALDLQPGGSSTRLAFYEPGHVFGVKYLRDSLPSEAQLLADLGAMLELYQTATERGGFEEFDLSHSIAEEEHAYETDITLEEKRRLSLHFRVERRKRLARLAKRKHGFKCQVCGFDYELRYGVLGRGYIEAHHLTPLSLLPPGQPVSLSPLTDFAVLCANCHRMIHRKGAPTTFGAFKAQFGQ